MSRTVTLLQPLNTFAVPSTAPPSVGRLMSGDYRAIQTVQQGTDEYVLAGVWICAASNGVTYAVVSRRSPPIISGISETNLVKMVQSFAGWTYNAGDPRYSAEIPNVVGLKLAPPKQNSCCILVEDLTVHAFDAAGWTFDWNQHCHDQMMVANWNNLWSPPQAIAESGLGVSYEAPGTNFDLPHPWTVCQGWGPSSGHTFVVVAAHAETTKVLIFESNNAYGLNGPGFRGLGPIANFPDGPPPNWWLEPGVPTWEQVLRYYSNGIAMSQLKVRTASLVWGR